MAFVLASNFTKLNDSLIESNKPFISTKSKEALLEENKTSLQNVIKTASDDYNTEANLGKDFVKVAFEDKISGQMVLTNLSSANLALLKNNFEENDFFLRDDGILRLNGKAQNFVSGWFEKVAYDMNLFGADKDKNGLVSGGELYDSFYYVAPFAPDSGAKIAYGESSAIFERNVERSIEDALNSVLLDDKNVDNKISFAEYLGLEKMLPQEIQEMHSDIKIDFSLLNRTTIKMPKKATLQEKVAEQGLASLSADELERFKIQNPTEYERLTQNQQKVESNNEELQALTDTLKQDFIKQIKEQSLSLIDIRA